MQKHKETGPGGPKTDKNMEKDRRDHKSGLTYKEWKLVLESGINPYPNLLSEKEKRLLRTANKYHVVWMRGWNLNSRCSSLRICFQTLSKLTIEGKRLEHAMAMSILLGVLS